MITEGELFEIAKMIRVQEMLIFAREYLKVPQTHIDDINATPDNSFYEHFYRALDSWCIRQKPDIKSIKEKVRQAIMKGLIDYSAMTTFDEHVGNGNGNQRKYDV